MSTRVGNRGQITIEKKIRDALGIQPGWRAVQRLVNGRLELQFLPPRQRRSVRGILGNPNGVKLRTDAEFQAAVERAWDEAAGEVAVGGGNASSVEQYRKGTRVDD